MTGYLHENYARALAKYGEPRYLSSAGAWVLERGIPDADARDGMGCYPFLTCSDWSGLASDLVKAGGNWVTLTAVTEPFAGLTETQLHEVFPDLVRPYKAHYVTDLRQPPGAFIHPHHQRNAIRARKVVKVHRGAPTKGLLEAWCQLYAVLIARHGIRGLTEFSAESFARQFEVPGLVVHWAESEERIVGMVLWYLTGDRAYYHLGAYDDAGYAARCSFALFLDAIEWFPGEGVRWLALGAGAGAGGENDGGDGLNRFKRGWATETRQVYLCGRVFDPEQCRALCARRGQAMESHYFPPYRAGEFK